MARSYDIMKKSDLAGENYKKAYEIAPDSIGTQFDYGFYLFNSKDYEGCVKVLDKVVKTDRKDETAITYRTNAFAIMESAYQMMKQEDKVKELYLEHLKLDPKNPQLNFNIGISYYQEQNLKDAEKYFKAALESGLDQAEAYLYLGNCRNVLEKYEDAKKVLEEGVEKYPDNAEMWNQLGKAYAHLNMRKEAEKAFKMFKKLQ
jgi:tetratricopeptide (TPR) repeat protein